MCGTVQAEAFTVSMLGNWDLIEYAPSKIW